MTKINKYCKGCNQEKKFSEFRYIEGYNKNKLGLKKYYKYYATYCRSCDKINLAKLNKRTRHKKKINNDDGSVRWSVYLRRLRSTKDSNIELKEFKIWLKKQNNKCTYCNFSLDEIKKVLKLFVKESDYTLSNKFQIDRMDNSIGYTLENICFACAICNSHKRDFFTYKEFKLISKKYIIPKIRNLLDNRL